MEAFDHEKLSTEALVEAKKIHKALLLDSLALGLLMMDVNKTAVDLLRIDSLVQFLWATAMGHKNSTNYQSAQVTVQHQQNGAPN